MRIGLVSQEYPPETGHGGIGSQTYLKAHGLAKLGHEIRVISHSPDSTTHRYRDGDVHVTRIPGFDNELPLHTEPARWITYSTRVAAALARLHRETPLDVVDFAEYGCEGYVHLLNQTHVRDTKAVIHLHGPLVMLAHTIGWPEPESEFYRVGSMMEGTCLRLADAIYSSSRCSAEWCERYHGVKTANVPVMHTGIDIDLFRPSSEAKPDRPTVVFVGKVVRNKGVEHLLEAALELTDEFPDLQVRMLGPGDTKLMSSLKARAAAEGRDDLLELPGSVARTDLPSHLSRAHVFAAPSVYEGGPGFVYLEAMACGLPVIACTGSGAGEVVTPEENGLLVPPGDVKALRDAIRRLLADEPGRIRMGERARRYVELEADTNVCTRRLENFYADVAATPTVPV